MLQITIHRSSVPFSPCIGINGSKKNLPMSRSDLNLVNFLLWRALRQKLYRQDFRDIDHLKRILLHWWVR